MAGDNGRFGRDKKQLLVSLPNSFLPPLLRSALQAPQQRPAPVAWTGERMEHLMRSSGYPEQRPPAVDLHSETAATDAHRHPQGGERLMMFPMSLVLWPQETACKAGLFVVVLEPGRGQLP